MTWLEIDDGIWDKDEGYLSKQKMRNQEYYVLKSVSASVQLIFKSLFSIHGYIFILRRKMYKS